MVFWRGEAGLAGPSARLQNLSLQDSECNVDIDGWAWPSAVKPAAGCCFGPESFATRLESNVDIDGWAWPGAVNPAAVAFGLARPGLLDKPRGPRIFFYRGQKATLDTDGKRG